MASQHRDSSSRGVFRPKVGDETEYTVVAHVPDDLPTQYADGVSILVAGGAVVITFLQTQYPAVLRGGKFEGNLRQVAVARIVMTEAKAKEFDTVLHPMLASEEEGA